MFLAGCGSSLDKIVRHLNADEYESAVVRAAGDPKLEQALAVLIVERHALRGKKAGRLVGVLAAAGRPGRKGLSRLVDREIQPAAGLAEVALHRGDSGNTERTNRLLGADSAPVRTAAARAWAASLTYDELEALVRDPLPGVRRAAVVGITRFEGERDVTGVLREALRVDPDPLVRADAARRGSLLGADGFYLLKGALKDASMGVVLAAVQGLAELGGEAATTLVEDLAVGPVNEVAVAAAAELCRKGIAPGRERLEAALTSEKPRIRAAALLRLERARHPNRFRILKAALDDKAPRVVLLASYALAHEPGPTEKLFAALTNVMEKSAHSAEEARDLLAVLGEEKAIDKVREALEEGDEAPVIRTIGRTRRAAALAGDFVQLMADTRIRVRLAAAQAVLTRKID